MANTDLPRNDGDTLAVPVMTTRRFVGLLWLLSGIPIGAALIFLPAEARLACFTVFVLLETGHSLSPIVLAWTHVSFRRQAVMAGPWKYIAIPGAVFAVTFAIGITTGLGWTSLVYGGHNAWRVTDWTNPLPVVMWIYWFWNIYHFGMQHFGVLRLVAPSSWRLGGMVACLAVTAFCMAAVPRLMGDQWVGFLLTGAFSVNHWVVDIGLSSWVSKRG